jgi:hypothetical protein
MNIQDGEGILGNDSSRYRNRNRGDLCEGLVSVGEMERESDAAVLWIYQRKYFRGD